MASVARDIGIERKVVEEYFCILEDLLIAERVPIFQKRAKRKLSAHPKFYFFDCGVYRTLRPSGPFDRPEGVDKVAFETLIYQEIRALNDYLRWGYEIFTWRTQTKEEVDFVLYGKKGIHAIEVKYSERIRDNDLKALEYFLTDYPSSKAWIIYFGKEPHFYLQGQVQAIPVTAFFEKGAAFFLSNSSTMQTAQLKDEETLLE